jgi:processive 1,2-diacylglycerol beta-glucosyltransferase
MIPQGLAAQSSPSAITPMSSALKDEPAAPSREPTPACAGHRDGWGRILLGDVLPAAWCTRVRGVRGPVSRDRRRQTDATVETSNGRAGRPVIRVLVLTAPVGEGHLAAARTLTDDILRTNDGAEVTVRDVLPALGRPLRWLLNDAYRWQLRSAPWLFGLLFGALRRSRLLRSLARAVLSLAGSRGLLRLVRRQQADVIVSTWPVATTILGCLRLRGKVRVPVCATITDFAGLELWADKGVDLHLVMHEKLVPGVERVAGRGSARPVSPLIGAQFLTPRSAAEARRALGLPAQGTIVVVSGGGWAVGDLEGAVVMALELDDVSVVCLAGRDAATKARLENAFDDEPRVTVLGFTDTMSDLLAAADVLVHSTGGVTCLEALARGCPVVAYGAPPGHAPLLAREMAALGLVVHARSAVELRAALMPSARKPTRSLAQGVDAASLVLAVAPRVTIRLRARLPRIAATAAALAVMLFALFASDATYPVVAEALALPESTSLSPAGHAVALVVRGRRRDLLALAPIARKDHLHASVAASAPLTAEDVATLRAAGLDPIPELRAGGIAASVEARGQLQSQVARYRLRGRFYYLAPGEGFTITDYLLARELGGAPIQAGHTLSNNQRNLGPLHPGEVVVATLDPDRGHGGAELVAAIRRLERSGLAVSSVQRLAGRRSS